MFGIADLRTGIDVISRFEKQQHTDNLKHSSVALTTGPCPRKFGAV